MLSNTDRRSRRLRGGVGLGARAGLDPFGPARPHAREHQAVADARLAVAAPVVRVRPDRVEERAVVALQRDPALGEPVGERGRVGGAAGGGAQRAAAARREGECDAAYASMPLNVAWRVASPPVEAPLIGIIVASTRDGRRGERVGAWFEAIARARDDIRCEVLDLLDWDLPWYRDAVVPPRGDYSARGDAALGGEGRRGSTASCSSRPSTTTAIRRRSRTRSTISTRSGTTSR